jgi:hypothetical protein
MAGQRKYGAHRHSLTIPAAAAGSGADVIGHIFTYDAFAEGGVTANGPASIYDPTVEAVVEMYFATYVVLTGQATNFVSPRVTHRNAAGSTVDQVKVDFSAAGVVTVAFVPANLSVASGAVVVGAGTGTLTLVAGVVLPWTLVPGDTITFDRLSNNATGLATPAMSLNFVIAQKGA